MASLHLRLGAALVALCLGCSSQGTTAAPPGDAAAGDGNAGDDAVTAGDDAGDAAASYPAFPPEMPTVLDQDGGKLTTAKIVTVTWASDTNAATLQDFDDKVGPSAYWKTALAEYGLGAGTSGAADHVVVQTASPNPWADTDIDTWVKTQASSPATSGWPAPDAQTIYVVFIPETVAITSSGQDACQQYSGYHVEVPAGSNPAGVAYALVLEACYKGTGVSLIDNATETAAHEILEAAADPYPNNAPGFSGFDAAHLGWDLWDDWQDELADACQNFLYAYYKEGADLPYAVQRIWSSASALAGHDPCVPRPSGPYFNVTPLGLEDVAVSAADATGTLQKYQSKGWHIPPGQTRTVQVGFYSDAPTGTWTVQPTEGDCCTSATTSLALTPAHLSGKNGDSAPLTIKVNAAPATGTAVLLTLTSSMGSVQHVMPVLVGAY